MPRALLSLGGQRSGGGLADQRALLGRQLLPSELSVAPLTGVGLGGIRQDRLVLKRVGRDALDEKATLMVEVRVLVAQI